MGSGWNWELPFTIAFDLMVLYFILIWSGKKTAS